MMQFLKATPRLPVADLARTIDFYIRTFGDHVASVWPKVAPNFVILENDNVEIQFYVPEGLAGEPSRQGTISFDVSDARAIHRSLEGHLTVEWGPEVYWYGRLEFAVCDPNGYMIILSEKTADPPTCLGG